MSPFSDVTTLEMSPNLEASTGGQIGTDSDELQGIATSRGIGAGRKRRAETGECGGDFGVELSADQAIGPALPRSGSGGTEAPDRRARVEPKEVKEISPTSIAVSGQEIFRGRK
jgi:hypothetical protein